MQLKHTLHIEYNIYKNSNNENQFFKYKEVRPLCYANELGCESICSTAYSSLTEGVKPVRYLLDGATICTYPSVIRSINVQYYVLCHAKVCISVKSM